MNACSLSILVAAQVLSSGLLADDRVVYQGGNGPGTGKHIVFVTGDEEYRSEESMPMLAKILAAKHGFKCTVLFSINPTNGFIDPVVLNNIPGLETLKTADLCVLNIRFRELPDDQMKHFVEYVNAGKPLIALRTSTHAFAYSKNKQSPYAKYDWGNKEWPGGFGRQILGETWVNHHGDHGKQSTRGIINEELKDHPILRGVKDIWGPTDVYEVRKLPDDAKVLVWGQVLTGMKPTDPPLEGPKNTPMMPLVWIRDYPSGSGRTGKALTSTIGAAVDLQSEDLRRLLVNACYFCVGLQDRIPEHADVAFVGEYKPSWFGFGAFKKNIKPESLAQ